MSQKLINRSTDLKRLQDDGYQVEVLDSYLLVHHVPYVNDKRCAKYGILVSPLTLSGDLTVRPSDHVVLWAGDYPCDSNGLQLVNLVSGPCTQQVGSGITTTHSFSQKPLGGYPDYYQKMTQYIRILEDQARAIKPDATSKTFLPVKLSEEESVFCYSDTFSSRIGITSINSKLKKDKIAIIGLGGTGSYILDLVAKTPVKEIHLFDADVFLQHNAFRSPGAASFDDLIKKPTKVERLAETYSKMRRKIFPHPQFINESNITELNSMDFVFLCMDKGRSRQVIADYLLENKIPFIYTGIGLYNKNETLRGSVQITTCTPSFHNHARQRISFEDTDDDNEYSSNIQIADINALNAALAVIKWKKMCGFYHDSEQEHHTVYGIHTNVLTSEEHANET